MCRVAIQIKSLACVGVWLAGLLVNAHCLAANWQYFVPFETGKADKAGAKEMGKALIWLPPTAQTIRGALVGGQLGIELEIALDPEVRKACAENDLAIVYFAPHIDGVFHYWDEKTRDGERWLKAFDDLAKRTGHPELRRAPWITMGHSTAGIFCRDVAYWQPKRVAGVLHIKSGNFHQKDHVPPSGSLSGAPLVAVNGQFETFGPEGGIRPEFGRQTQWIFVRRDIEQFQKSDDNCLMSQWVDLGGDHFHGSPELSQYAALFIRKTAKYRIPAKLPDGDGAVDCLPLKRSDGWLVDPDLEHPAHPPAAYADYTGDKQTAMWVYDREIAEATAAHHRNFGNHQAISQPELTWLDEGDGWRLKAKAAYLDKMPDAYGGTVAGMKVGHAASPILYRSKINEPVERVSDDTFRLLRPVKTVNIAAVNVGDDKYRATNRWAGLAVPAAKGQAQTIDFPEVPSLKAGDGPREIKAKASSGLPVYYEVDYGPIEVRDGKLVISELPQQAVFPLECRVIAWQIGSRHDSPISPAPPVSRQFEIVK